MIKKYYIIFAVLVLIVMTIGCNRLEFESRWSENPISIDGNDTDWEPQSLHQMESMPVSLGLRNDEEFLYILLSVENPMMAENLRASGISLWFTRENEKHPNLGLHYTGSDTLWSDSDPDDSFWETLTTDQKKQFRVRQLELKNMIKVVQGKTSLRIHPDGTQGPAAATVSQQGIFGYEFKIPIQTNENRPYALGSRLGETVGIGILMGDLESEDKQKIAPQGYPAGGAPGVGGMRGRGGSAMGPMSRNALMGERQVWFRVILADKSR